MVNTAKVQCLPSCPNCGRPVAVDEYYEQFECLECGCAWPCLWRSPRNGGPSPQDLGLNKCPPPKHEGDRQWYWKP